MKWKIYTLLIFMTITSCRSVQKLVDQGEYDEAIYIAAEKLHGKKHKKTKHVKSLEKAFGKVTERDMDFINALRADLYPERWDKVYEVLAQIDRRQHKVAPFLPLVSKDGYLAHFEMVEVNPLLAEAAEQASAHHYAEASRLLDGISYDKKRAATDAHAALRKIDNYFDNYQNKDALKETAHHYGMTRVHIDIHNAANVVMTSALEAELLSINLVGLNSFWTQYYRQKSAEAPMDFRAIIEIEELEVSPERESESIYVDTRQIQDGYNYVLDTEGNVAKDTLGNDIREDRYIEIRAEVYELYREKAAYVKGSLKIIDLRKDQIIDHFPIASEATYQSYASRYSGDERALATRTRNRLRTSPDRFPADEELIWQAAEDVKIKMADYLSGIRYF